MKIVTITLIKILGDKKMKKSALLFSSLLLLAILIFPGKADAQGIYAPSGNGAWGNMVYAGVGFTSPQPFYANEDMIATVGFGLGNPAKNFGLQVSTDLQSVRNHERYSFNAKVHRYLGKGVSMAFGLENFYLQNHPASYRNSPKNVYLAMTQDFRYKVSPAKFGSRFSYSIGVGIGRFSKLSPLDIAQENGLNIDEKYRGTYLFGAAQFRVSKWLNYHIEWSGVNLNSGLSVNGKVWKVPFKLMVGVADLTPYSGDRLRFIAGLGIAYRFENVKFFESGMDEEEMRALMDEYQAQMINKVDSLKDQNDKILEEQKKMNDRLDAIEDELKKLNTAVEESASSSNETNVTSTNSSAIAGTIFDNLLFATNSYALTSTSKSELDKLANVLSQNQGVNIDISGYADNKGSLAVNQALSNNRAKAAFNYLTSKGVAANRMAYKGYAYFNPVASNDNTNGRRLNRRVEFKSR